MGLLDRFKAQPRGGPAQSAMRVSPPIAPVRPIAPGKRERPPLHAAQWLPAGASVVIGGYTIVGGLLYVGSSLPVARPGVGSDPALINPDLPIGRRPDISGQELSYWPGYGSISPDQRTAYLAWLSTGRSNPEVPIGYVFLYFYGLERRILIDCAASAALRAEVPALRAEVERLLSIYGGYHPFRRYATSLLGLVGLMLGGQNRTPPEYTGEKWPVPVQLRVVLGEYGRARAPIPASWAMAWALFGPEIYPRTPVVRCPDEFARLFHARYTARFGPGMVIPVARKTVTVEYMPASSGLAQTAWDTKLPDVFELEAPLKVLGAIVDEVTDELDSYSRWLGRHPDGKDTLAALAWLPAALIDPRREPVRGLLGLIERRLSGADQALIDGLDLVRAWGASGSSKLTKQESSALAQLLAGQGFGLEPDPRFGGSPLGASPAVVFRVDRDNAPQVASSAYTSATTVIRLAAAVASADRSSVAEQDYLTAHAESALGLSPEERKRLRAHLHLLLSSTVKLTGLTARMADLAQGEREQTAALCLAVAAADGVIAPAEISTLTKIYKLLGLPDSRVFQDIHATTAAESEPAREPVTVSPGRPREETGYLLPAQPPANPTASKELGLDRAAISAKIADTERVSALLGSIFVEDEAQPQQVQPTQITESAPIASLDGPHSALLRDLARADSWSRAAVEDMCAKLGLLTDGALEVLNDAAFDCVGDPVVNGADPLEIDLDVMEEMQR
ncbi:TerB N-terminal domain-containing protein [Actinospica sp. MGRD01-02]|uniref:TerB N-terminal domain-containing protein n=1 Tax=Actinospica acidithermotolerans TaxID=2828514 RepID=A0A941EEZ3_9ACTN|nr:TerB N-terminal domain-containing protein [Actinospica acidithermotolerans]MBR7829300.1 TerB N-terminal domain-containing protein [Actinospica acidithermotolerans]